MRVIMPLPFTERATKSLRESAFALECRTQRREGLTIGGAVLSGQVCRISGGTCIPRTLLGGFGQVGLGFRVGIDSCNGSYPRHRLLASREVSPARVPIGDCISQF